METVLGCAVNTLFLVKLDFDHMSLKPGVNYTTVSGRKVQSKIYWGRSACARAYGSKPEECFVALGLESAHSVLKGTLTGVRIVMFSPRAPSGSTISLVIIVLVNPKWRRRRREV